MNLAAHTVNLGPLALAMAIAGGGYALTAGIGALRHARHTQQTGERP